MKAGAGSDHAEPPLSSHCSSPTSSKLEASLPPAKIHSYETYGTPDHSTRMSSELSLFSVRGHDSVFKNLSTSETCRAPHNLP